MGETLSPAAAAGLTPFVFPRWAGNPSSRCFIPSEETFEPAPAAALPTCPPRQDTALSPSGTPSGAPWVCAALGALPPWGARRGVEGEGRGGLPPWGARPWRPVEAEGVRAAIFDRPGCSRVSHSMRY